jgi:hypothetical protein
MPAQQLKEFRIEGRAREQPQTLHACAAAQEHSGKGSECKADDYKQEFHGKKNTGNIAACIVDIKRVEPIYQPSGWSGKLWNSGDSLLIGSTPFILILLFY